MSNGGRDGFEQQQAELKQMAAQADRDAMRSQMSINAMLAGIFNQLVNYPVFREFLDANFRFEHGVDHEAKQLFINVVPKNSEWEPDGKDLFGVSGGQEENEEADGENGEGEGEQ